MSGTLNQNACVNDKSPYMIYPTNVVETHVVRKSARGTAHSGFSRHF